MARDSDTGTLNAGNWAPVREERDDYALPVKGELPRELRGTLFRNGPNPQFDTPDAHWFVGDGMLHAFTLENGKASYRNRWVRTPKFLAEHDAGRANHDPEQVQDHPRPPLVAAAQEEEEAETHDHGGEEHDQAAPRNAAEDQHLGQREEGESQDQDEDADELAHRLPAANQEQTEDHEAERDLPPGRIRRRPPEGGEKVEVAGPRREQEEQGAGEIRPPGLRPHVLESLVVPVDGGQILRPRLAPGRPAGRAAARCSSRWPRRTRTRRSAAACRPRSRPRCTGRPTSSTRSG